jgi:hypothetical protein
MAKNQSYTTTRTLRGYRLDCIMTNGERKFVNVDAPNEDSMRMRVYALGGKSYKGIAEVLSFETHSWEQEFVSLDIFRRNTSV